MKTKKYIIEINIDDPFISNKGEKVYYTTDACHSFFEEELKDMEEIVETPKDSYNRGYEDGMKEAIDINKEVLLIESHAKEIVKLYNEMWRNKKYY